tara:strand:- start:682 stop:840 length:159 start_codon:yes stop_codon:yes gene_type:complete
MYFIIKKMEQQIIVYPSYIRGISMLNTDKNKKLNDKTKILSLMKLLNDINKK